MKPLLIAFFAFFSFCTGTLAQNKGLSIQIVHDNDHPEAIGFEVENQGTDTCYYAISLQALKEGEWKEADPDILNNIPNKAIIIKAIVPGGKEKSTYPWARLEEHQRTTSGKFRLKVQYGTSNQELDKNKYSEIFSPPSAAGN
jgi:hypothetical protein